MDCLSRSWFVANAKSHAREKPLLAGYSIYFKLVNDHFICLFVLIFCLSSEESLKTTLHAIMFVSWSRVKFTLRAEVSLLHGF